LALASTEKEPWHETKTPGFSEIGQFRFLCLALPPPWRASATALRQAAGATGRIVVFDEPFHDAPQLPHAAFNRCAGIHNQPPVVVPKCMEMP
jgi:hypothetical protein